ncbi:MAG: radical SAM protein [Promethearchaeota archaeon]
MKKKKVPPYYTLKKRIRGLIDENYIKNFTKRNTDVYPLFDNIIRTNFNKQISLFTPGNDFPSLSVTGNACELRCEHCNTKYLHGMKDVSSGEKMRKTLDELISRGVKGCLISGGCDSDGKVPFLQFKDILHEYKEKHNLIYNFHTGLLNEEEIKELAEIPPDIVSYDFTVDEEIIHNVYHLDKKPKDYSKTLENMIKYGIRVIPHVTIGLNFGRVKKEIDTLEYLLNHEFDLIVFIVLIPPKDSEKFKPTNITEVTRILMKARLMFPLTELSLGCMRPKNKELRVKIEDSAVAAGINRFALPSKKTVRKLIEKGYEINKFNACCAIPLDLY